MDKLKEDVEQKNDFKMLDICHHYASGMKTVCTEATQAQQYLIRQSLGGAGYSAWSGLPNMIDDYSPNVTWEGDSTVMSQQCANYLFKIMADPSKFPAESLDPPMRYILSIDQTMKLKSAVTTPEGFLDLD